MQVFIFIILVLFLGFFMLLSLPLQPEKRDPAGKKSKGRSSY